MTLDHAFDCVRPKEEFIEAFSPYQELYRVCGDKFEPSNIITQPGWDTAYILATYKGGRGYEHRFRIEGTYNSSKFRITRVLKRMCNGGLMVLAEF